MKKIVRDMSTAENKRFWESAERTALEVQQWPDWKRAGINVAQIRDTPREAPPAASAKPPASNTQ